MKALKIFSCFVLSVLLISCSNNNLPKDSFSIRVLIKSEPTKDVSIKVILENESGQVINGALVMAESQTGIVSILDFDNSIQAYSGTIAGLQQDKYSIIVKSNLLQDSYTLEVPHTRINTKPVLISFTDASGNDVLKGNSLTGSKKIQLIWNGSGDNVNYQVIIKDTVSTKWTASTDNCNITIPENALSNGTYYLMINAQKSYGDLYYETKPYFSVSNISSSSVSFCIE